MNFKTIHHSLKNLWRNQDGLATLESAILLPMMLIVLMGMYDIGQAIIINQKITAASHMANDLITRRIYITDSNLDDAYGLAQLVIDPYERDLMGIDIAGIRYDEDNDPEVIWRYTQNMIQDNSIPGEAGGLGIEGEGIVSVTATYKYSPKFSSLLINDIDMTERSYLRGRKNSFVRYEEDED